jgi:tetratricopeptide (TPR) repeat protein
VRTIDIAPTILELVGVASPAEVQGVSLVALASGQADDLALEAYGESRMPRHYGWSELRSLRDAAYQYIEAPRPELYDVVADPAETENLAPTRAATVRSLRDQLRELESSLAGARASEAEALPVPVDPSSAAKLKALGYLGSGASPRVDPGVELADPKDKIGLFNRIREAAAAADAGEPASALTLLEAVVAEDPAVVEAHNALGRVQLELGHPERAVEAYRDALARDATYVPALTGLAQAYHALGRDDDAAAGLERALELAPGSAPAATLLARIHVDAGRSDQALEVLDRELAGDPDAPGVHYVRAVALERQGNFEGAIEEYENELRIAPGDYRAHFDLAKLLGQRGRGSEMLEHLEKSIEANPRFPASRFYFANALLESGEPARAADEASQGLALDPEPELAPFGHFILADAYTRLGRTEEAAKELARAQELQRQATSSPRQK